MTSLWPTLKIGEDGRSVDVLDQRLLPFQTEWFSIADLDTGAVAIQDMVVRGAPLIGVTAAYALWVVSLGTRDRQTLDQAIELLAKTRPTAVNLFFALDRARHQLDQHADQPEAWPDCLRALADDLAREDADTNKAIGDFGLEIIREIFVRTGRPVQILTHCNAGRLATTCWGTATAPIYRAQQEGIPIHVWVDETRPRNQGLLTAWELAESGVPHTLIVDNAGGQLMQEGRVDLCLVGTDRTTRNGDVANKIGTYLKALAAHAQSIPFYVALPSSTIDWALASGMDIPIEERSGDEIRRWRGVLDGRIVRVDGVDAQVPVRNPAFDITPACYVTGLITERGISPASEDGLLKFFPERRTPEI